MMTSPFSSLRRIAGIAALCAIALGLAAPPAQARVFVGFGFGVPWAYGPGFYPPPYYYPPPVYYPPPPVYYAPPQTYAPVPSYTPGPTAQVGQSCHAGAYVCPMDRPVAPGSSCYCLGNGGQRIWGRAN
ncbi:hypothetical protein [Rhodopila globiformis]|uniref:hypothetical protein n=1 Tax=Rhodopila globiformis TaxID=1071 RepID=UPI0011B0D3C4|nr:hypothetical protein [Rhodopila globiformis]